MAINYKNNINLNGNYLINSGIERLSVAPANPKTNQLYIDSTNNVIMQYTGSATGQGWKMLGSADAIVFKGTVGSGGTIDDLPTNVDAVSNGDLYVVCTKGSYGPEDATTHLKQYAVVGDQFIASKNTTATPNTLSWQYIPSGNDSYSADIIGDGTTTFFTINHALNTRDVTVQIYDICAGGTGEQIFTDVKHTDVNSVMVVFDTAPAVSENYRVVVHA